MRFTKEFVDLSAKGFERDLEAHQAERVFLDKREAAYKLRERELTMQRMVLAEMVRCCNDAGVEFVGAL